MNYVEVVNLIFEILGGIYVLMMLHFVVFFAVGLFKRKVYPATSVENRYGVIIPARNEEAVVGNLIESIRRCDYPQDKIEIFVIAHNCSDRTAEVARARGAVVYEYNNPEECTMGYAIRHLFEEIEKDYGRQNYDGFFMFNADNIVSQDYFRKMNDAFEYYNHECVITSFRNSKNFGYNTMSGLYGIYFALGCYLESRGRTVTGCSTRVQGTGYVISSKVVKDGWPYVSLTEDWEFTVDRILAGEKIRYCDEAVFYDEQPTNFHIMWRQRLRWSRGHLLVCYARVKDLIRAIFARETIHRGSVYDIFTNILPFCLIWALIVVIHYGLLLLAPLHGIPLEKVFFPWDTSLSAWANILQNPSALLEMALGTIAGTILTALTAALVFIMGRKRILNVSLPRKIWLSLMWPFFLMLQFPIDVQAFFSHNLGWKPIPHQDETTICVLEGEQNPVLPETTPQQG